MKIFGKKADSLNDAFGKYTDSMKECIAKFEAFFEVYLTEVCGDDLEQLARYVRYAESKCDDALKEVEKIFATGAFMPNFRSDIFSLMDLLDKVPNKAEEVSVLVSTVCVSIPKAYKDQFREMVKITSEAVHTLSDAMELLLVDLDKAVEKAQSVEYSESAVDKIERQLYKDIFHYQDNSVTMGDKLMLREIIKGVANLTDKAEDVYDHISLMLIKRKS